MAVTSSHSHYQNGFTRGSLIGFCIGIMCMLLYQNIFATITSNYNNEVKISSAALEVTGGSNTDETSIIGLDSLLKHDGVHPSIGTDAAIKTTQTPVKYIRPTVSRQPGDVLVRPSIPEVIAIDTSKVVAVAKDTSKVVSKVVAVAKDNSKIVASSPAATSAVATSDSKLIRYSLILTHSLTFTYALLYIGNNVAKNTEV